MGGHHESEAGCGVLARVWAIAGNALSRLSSSGDTRGDHRDGKATQRDAAALRWLTGGAGGTIRWHGGSVVDRLGEDGGEWRDRVECVEYWAQRGDALSAHEARLCGTWACEAKDIMRAQVRGERTQAAERFRTWAAQRFLKENLRSAHLWANRPNVAQAELTAPCIEGGRTYNPQQVVDHHTAAWDFLWRCPTHLESEVLQLPDRVRQRALDEQAWPCEATFSAEGVRKVASWFKNRTSTGIDGVTIRAWPCEADIAVAHFGELLRAAARNVVLPIQGIGAKLHCIGKPSGSGSRTIATLSTFYRVLNALCGEAVAEWDERVAHPWDSAVKGNSAFAAGLMRTLQVELASEEHLVTLQVLWDFEQFYETVLLPKVVEKAVDLGYPIWNLAIGIQAHLGPRLLDTGLSVGQWIRLPSRSLVTGCRQSGSWARALLHDVLGRIARGYPRAPPGSHVDDISQIFSCPSGPVAVRWAVGAAAILADEVRELGLRFSGKSMILPGASRHAATAARIIQSAGIPIRLGRRGKDLGVETTGGRRRCGAIQASRVQKAKVRAHRIGIIARAGKPGKHALYTGGAKPQQEWGQACHGTPPSVVKAMRANAVAATGTRLAGACDYTAAAWTYGDWLDPAVTASVQQVLGWWTVWKACDEGMKQRVKKQWGKVWRRLVTTDTSEQWGKVRGVMSATVLTLIRDGWTPFGPDKWMAPSRDMRVELDSGEPFLLGQLIAEVKKHAIGGCWTRAAARQDGSGLQRGRPDISISKRVHQWLRKNKRNDEAAALRAVTLGAVWPQGRRKAGSGGGESTASNCPFCGGEATETLLHRFWQCRALDGFADPAVTSTNYLASRAVEEAETYACMWLRGILPGEQVDFGARQVKAGEVQYYETARQYSWEAAASSGEIVVYTDGAGAPKWTARALGRVGAGGVAVDCRKVRGTTGEPPTLPWVGFCSGVPGAQTVPRAELWAATTALRIAKSHGARRVRIVSDAAYVTGGAARRGGERLRYTSGSNGDLWYSFYELIDGWRSNAVSIDKVKAHRDYAAVQARQLDFCDWVGNIGADAAAGAAAEKGQLSGGLHAEVQKYEALGWKVCRRLAAIEAYHRRTSPQTVQLPHTTLAVVPTIADWSEAARALRTRVRTAGHQLQTYGKRVRCVLCARAGRLEKASSWTRQRCSGAGCFDGSRKTRKGPESWMGFGARFE